MASTFTPNINAEEPGRGDQVGVWDTPVNSNMTLLDLVSGGTATISLNNSNVLLGNTQFQAARITFNSTLTGNVTITFPTSFKKRYDILNLCTGSSAFTITLATTAAGGQVIGCPPGQSFEAWNDGTNLVYHNFGPPIGGYWDYAGSSNPAWNTLCTVDPYLPCDGTTFASSIYPALAIMLGGTTLPDSRGRARFALNSGTGRITAGGGGVDGNTNYSGGGNELLQAHTHANSLNDPGHFHNIQGNNNNGGFNIGITMLGNALTGTNRPSDPATTGITITNASFGAGGSQNMPPAYVGGLTLIRAG